MSNILIILHDENAWKQPLSQNLDIWPHTAAKEAGKQSLFGSHVAS